MAGDEDPKEFPDVSHKLSAPKKLSAFERERLAAEDKKRREQAENAAALKEFEDSFAEDGNNDDFDGFPRLGAPPNAPRGPGMGFGGPPGRFGAYGGVPPRSGPGSLGPVPGMEPPNLRRKRALDEMREQQEARRDHEDFTAEYNGRGQRHGGRKANERDEEETDVAPRPTVQLSSLPPSTTEEDIQALLKGHLPVHSVQMQPPAGPAGPSSTTRKSLAAIAQLAAGTSTAEIDKAVSALKDKYLGCGFNLSISRFLSSTALQPNMTAAALSSSSTEPFGSQKVNKDQPVGFSMRNAPPPSNFAPPGSYDAVSQTSSPADAIVGVQSPLAMETTRAIHTLVDRLLSEPDPNHALELEALLMALPEIQNDENFSFLYDSRSPAGVYYRFLLWSENAFDVIQARKSAANSHERIMDDVALDWEQPVGEVPFADLATLGDVLDHENYPSDGESDFDEDVIYAEQEGEKGPDSHDTARLTPLHAARLSWMLSQMPKSHTLLRQGQVAAITSFAIRHARVGAEEIVNIMLLNIEKPYNTSLCAKAGEGDDEPAEDDDYEPGEDLPAIDATTQANDARVDKAEAEDPSLLRLVALYLISDILHSCATAKAKNAWKYRVLFENAFKQRKTFQYLGQLEKELGFGKIRADNWRRRVHALLQIWEQGNIFAIDSFDAIKKDFARQTGGENAETAAVEAKKTQEKLMGRFKRVGGIAASPSGSASPAPAVRRGSLAAETSDLDGVPMDEDLDGVPMDEGIDGEPMNDDLDGEPMEDLDGVPMDEDLDGVPMDDASGDEPPPEPVPASKASTIHSRTSGFSLKGSNGHPNSNPAPAVEPPRRRKLAEDMFADSDEE